MDVVVVVYMLDALPVCALRHESHMHLFICWCFATLTHAQRALSVAGPLVWNLLWDYLRDPAVSRDTFSKHLQVLLFVVYCYIQHIRGFVLY